MRQSLVPMALGLAVLAGPAAAQQFSADMVTSGGHEGKPGKIYVSGDKVRMDNGHGAMIADGKADKTYVLMPEQKMYMDMPAKGGQMTQIFMPVDVQNPCPQWQKIMSKDKDNAITSCKRVGEEQVNGRNAVKYQATGNDGKVHYAWLDTKLRFLVKTQDPDGNGMQLQNIKEGTQAASLFELPSDYRKFDMQQMMQQRMQSGAQHP